MPKKRAFVRYTKSGEIVPGSLILTNGSYPDKPALWKEVTVDQCCDGGGGCNLPPVILSYNISQVIFDGIVYFDISCSNSVVLSTSVTFNGTITPQQYVDGLNEAFGWMGTFTLNGNIIVCEFNGYIAQAMCPDGELTFSISNPPIP